MDNKIFNVNGRTKEQLALAVKLLLLDEYGHYERVKGWYFDIKKGLILTWHVGEKYNAIPFTNRMGLQSEIQEEELVELLFDWINSPQAKTMEHEGWDVNTAHDGSNELGWRLYTENWGHIEPNGSLDHYSIAAFKPAYLWYGK